MVKSSAVKVDLTREFQPKVLIPTLTAAMVTGVIAVSNTIIYGSLVFSNELSPYVSSGVGIALFSGMVLSLIVALLGSVPNLVAYPQAAIAPIQTLLAVGIVQSMTASGAAMDQVFGTVIVGLAFSSFFVGIVFLIFGRFKLGKLIRFLPYPVIGGFLAGLGWLLVVGGMKVMSISLTSWDGFLQLFDSGNFLRWFPGVALGLAYFILVKRFKHYAVLPLCLFASLVLFYGLVAMMGISLENLMAQGWLLGPFPDSGLWQPLAPQTIIHADWIVILKQFGTLAVLTLTGLIGILINYSGIELETRQDIDFDQDLQATGLATLLTGFGGGPMGYPSASLSILPYQIGARSRLVGVFVSGLFALTLFLGSTALAYLPRVVIGGLLVYFGLGLLFRWVVLTRKSLPKYDYFVLLLILLVIASVNLLTGVVVGVIVTFALFAINYSQIHVVRNTLTGKSYQSNVDRALYHQEYLREQGESLLILKLQGFIFFGTAFQLLSEVRQRAEDSDLPPLRFVIMDFRLVNGVDSSALNSFSRMLQLAESNGFTLVVANATLEVENQLVVGGILSKGSGIVRLFQDLDHAVEWCENTLLYQEEVTMVMLPSLKDQLRSRFANREDLETFMAYLEKQQVPINTVLIHQGDPPCGIYFVDRGQVRAELPLPSGETTRLRTMGEGTIIGELGFYLQEPASANVITELPSTLYYLPMQALAKMEQNDPKLAAVFHKYLAETVSKRLVNTNATVQALLD